MCGRSLLGARNFRTAAEEFSQVTLINPTNAWVSKSETGIHKQNIHTCRFHLR